MQFQYNIERIKQLTFKRFSVMIIPDKNKLISKFCNDSVDDSVLNP